MTDPAPPVRVSYGRWQRSLGRTLRAIGLCLPGILLATSCFFAPLPLPDDPRPERPNLNLSGAVPPVSQVLHVNHGDTPISFTIPFTSVDAGQDIWWFLWVNWNLSGAQNEKKDDLPAAPAVIDDGLGGATSTERAIQFSWTPSGAVQPGCNQLSLLVTHFENADFSIDQPKDMSQAAIVTYWVNVDAPIDQPQTLVDCPPAALGP